MPIPLALPTEVPTFPPPTSVVTCLVEIIIVRITLFLLSTTYNRPVESSSAMPSGSLNLATLPTPSALPATPHSPTRVETARVERTTVRTARLNVSRTYKIVSMLFATSRRGRLNVADVPIPLMQDATPAVPAIVEIVFVRVFNARTSMLPLSLMNTVSETLLAKTP